MDNLTISSGFTDTFKKYDPDRDSKYPYYIFEITNTNVLDVYESGSYHELTIEYTFKRTDFGDFIIQSEKLPEEVYQSDTFYVENEFDEQKIQNLYDDLKTPDINVQTGTIVSQDWSSFDLTASDTATVTLTVGYTKLGDNEFGQEGVSLTFGKGSVNWSLDTTISHSGFQQTNAISYTNQSGDHLAIGRPYYGFGDDFGRVEIWSQDGSTRKVKNALDAKRGVTSCSFKADDTKLAVGVNTDNGGEGLYIVDVASWSEDRRLGSSGDVYQNVCWAGDGSFVAGGTEAGSARVWETSNWTTVLQTGTSATHDIQADANGDWVAFGDGADIRIFESSNWTEISSSPITPNGETIEALSFKPDGSELAATTYDSGGAFKYVVHYYNTSDWSNRLSTQPAGNPSKDSRPLDLQYSSDGQYLTLTHIAGQVVVYDRDKTFDTQNIETFLNQSLESDWQHDDEQFGVTHGSGGSKTYLYNAHGPTGGGGSAPSAPTNLNLTVQ